MLLHVVAITVAFAVAVVVAAAVAVATADVAVLWLLKLVAVEAGCCWCWLLLVLLWLCSLLAVVFLLLMHPLCQQQPIESTCNHHASNSGKQNQQAPTGCRDTC